jgi:hypothetical protein
MCPTQRIFQREEFFMNDRRRLACALAAAIFLTLAPTGRADEKKDADGWVQLFNGKDLTGWKLHPKANKATKWEVKGGWLVGSDQASMLYSGRDDYANFHYRVTAKINEGGNSGQYFRAQFVPGFQTGIEAQLNATHRDPIKTGSLYFPKVKELLVLDKAPHGPDEEFTQEVIANGPKITVLVNGKKTVEWTDPDYAKRSKGHFALQQHDPKSVISFRKIEVKELPVKSGE